MLQTERGGDNVHDYIGWDDTRMVDRPLYTAEHLPNHIRNSQRLAWESNNPKLQILKMSKSGNFEISRSGKRQIH